MKLTLIALALALVVFGITPLAVASDNIFASKDYLQGEAGVIGPVDREESMPATVSVPIVLWEGDRNNFNRFTVEKNTNLSGTAPDFNTDYLAGEGGLVNPIESHMEK